MTTRPDVEAQTCLMRAVTVHPLADMNCTCLGPAILPRTPRPCPAHPAEASGEEQKEGARPASGVIFPALLLG